MNRRLAIHTLIVFSLALLGIAVRAYDRDTRGLDYDERTTLEYVESCTPEVFGDYLMLRNVRDPNRVPMNTLSMQDFRSFPAWSVFARAVHEPEDHFKNIDRLRWISIIFGGLTVPLAYLLGLRFGCIAAWLTALFMLLHPTLHFHSQNIRFYALLGFASTAALAWYVWVMPLVGVPALAGFGTASREEDRLEPGLQRNLALIASGAIVGLLFTIHIGVIFPLAVMLVIAWYHLRFSRAFAVLLLSAAVFSLIPLSNVGHFFYVRTYADKSVEEMVNSAGPVMGLAAVGFNLGFGYCAVALLNWWRVHEGTTLRAGSVSDRSHVSPLLWGIALALFGVVAAFALKAELLRADYVLGLFPLVMLAAALPIQALAARNGWLLGGILAALALMTVVPSFVSTAAVDGDRVDYLTLIRYLHEDTNGEKCAVVADSPFSIEYLDVEPGPKPVYLPVAANADLSGYQRVYWVMKERKGFLTNRYAGFGHIEGTLVKIIGKDRLDLRSSKLYVFRLVRKGME